MKIAIGCDHGGFELKEYVKNYLVNDKGLEVVDFGTNSEESVDYPEYGKKVGEYVVNKECDCGIVICGTGIGISISANKVKGVRAALCTGIYEAKMTRLHNNANVLALGGRVVGKGLALEIVDTFLTTEYEGGRHDKRVEAMMKIEEE